MASTTTLEMPGHDLFKAAEIEWSALSSGILGTLITDIAVVGNREVWVSLTKFKKNYKQQSVAAIILHQEIKIKHGSQT